MGYTTNFYGELTLSREMTEIERDYINTFSKTRRMKRDPKILMEIYKGKHGYPFPKGNTPEDIYGNNGQFFAFDDGNCGQMSCKSIIDYNGFNNNVFPGLWCQWIIDNIDTGDILKWDGSEKFYNYVEWLQYLISNFFEPWNIKLNGEIKWEGEHNDDMGIIVVNDNVVTKKIAKITYE